mgnify:CR=1 FL=1
MKSLNKLTILQLTLVSSILFGLSFLVFVARDVNSTWNKYAFAEQDSSLVSLLIKIENVAHHHAIERGLTAGYLANPSSDKKSKLLIQRDKADVSISNLKGELSKPSLSSQKLTPLLAELFNTESKKLNIRAQVDSHNKKGVFAYYSQLTRVTLDAAKSVTLKLSNSSMAQQLDVALLYANYKERAGQTRGKVNGYLSSPDPASVSTSDLSLYVADSDLYVRYLKNLLTGEELSRFNQILDSNESRTLQNTTKAFLNGNYASINISPNRWFETATNHIGDIKQRLEAQLSQVNALAVQTKENAFVSLIVLLSISVFIICLTLIINIVLIKTLKRQLTELSGNLESISEHGDLTVDVNLRSNNELGIISKAFHETLSAIKKLITSLYLSISESNKISNELNTVTKDIVDGADVTEQKSTSIASAIEEMAVTSEDISSSAGQTFTETSNLNDNAAQALELSQKSESAMRFLSQNLSEVQQKAAQMERKVSEINGFLETINSLSEQTNLLALNAAIEAARAGEHGRGFAVVADEVRTLAQGSRESSDQISSLLKDLQQASFDVVDGINDNVKQATESAEAANQVKAINNDLKVQVNNVEQLATSVSAASEQQSLTAKEMAVDINSVLLSARNQLDNARALRTLYDDIENNSHNLKSQVSAFQID